MLDELLEPVLTKAFQTGTQLNALTEPVYT